MGNENIGGQMPEGEYRNFSRTPRFYEQISEREPVSGTERNSYVEPGDSQAGLTQDMIEFLKLPQEAREQIAAYLRQFVGQEEGSDYTEEQETVNQETVNKVVDELPFEPQRQTQEPFTAQQQAAHEAFQQEQFEELTAESLEYPAGSGDRPVEHREQPVIVRRSLIGTAANWVEEKIEDAKDFITKPQAPKPTEERNKLHSTHDTIKKRNARRKRERKGKSPRQLMERGGIELGTGAAWGTVDALQIMTHTVISSPAVTVLQEAGIASLAAGFIVLGGRNVVNGVVDKVTEWREPRIANKLKKDHDRRHRHNEYLQRQQDKDLRRRGR